MRVSVLFLSDVSDDILGLRFAYWQATIPLTIQYPTLPCSTFIVLCLTPTFPSLQFLALPSPTIPWSLNLTLPYLSPPYPTLAVYADPKTGCCAEFPNLVMFIILPSACLTPAPP